MAAAAHRAAGLRIHSAQIFTANQRRWKAPAMPEADAETFRREMSIPVLAHASYLINPAGSRPGVTERSRQALADELERMARLGIRWMVLHPGSHLGDGPKLGMERAAAMLGEALESCSQGGILLENTAGQGSVLGGDLRELARLRELIAAPTRTGFCIDTAHLHGAGYDLSPERLQGTVERMLEELGGGVRAFHLNDSLADRGSLRDRHQTAGRGEIGMRSLAGLAAMPVFADLPAVVETPGTDVDRERDARLIGRCSEMIHSN